MGLNRRLIASEVAQPRITGWSATNTYSDNYLHYAFRSMAYSPFTQKLYGLIRVTNTNVYKVEEYNPTTLVRTNSNVFTFPSGTTPNGFAITNNGWYVQIQDSTSNTNYLKYSTTWARQSSADFSIATGYPRDMDTNLEDFKMYIKPSHTSGQAYVYDVSGTNGNAVFDTNISNIGDGDKMFIADNIIFRFTDDFRNSSTLYKYDLISNSFFPNGTQGSNWRCAAYNPDDDLIYRVFTSGSNPNFRQGIRIYNPIYG